MAEEILGTQTRTGQESPAPGGEGPTSNGQAPSTTVELPQANSLGSPPPPQTQRELEELRALSERYKQQLQGWEQQSRKHQEDNARLQEQLRQYDVAMRQAQAQAAQVQASQAPQVPARPRPGSFKEAMDRYLSGDDQALDQFQAATQSSTPAAEEVAHIVDTRLNNYLAYMGKQQAVTQAHPELTDRTHPIYREAYDLYDTIAADPLSRALYPDDPSMQVSIVSPDGTSQKNMDLRILNNAVLQVKARTSSQSEHTRRSGAGDSLTANGAAASSQNSQVEALEMFSPDEQREFDNQIRLRLLPREWPHDIRALSKYLWDGMNPVEKQKRIEQYRERLSRGR